MFRQPALLELGRRDIAQGAVQALLIEVTPIGLNRPAGIGPPVEHFQVQALIPQAAVEALIDPVCLRCRLHPVGTMQQECFASSTLSILSVASSCRW